MLPATVRSWLAEPAVADPPDRVWRDWAVVGVATVVAALEVSLRSDADFGELSGPWRVATFVAFVAVVPFSILTRRANPLWATAVGFAGIVGFGLVLQWRTGELGGLVVGLTLLIPVYALYRWGSGRDGGIGLGLLVVVAIVGNLSSARSPSDVIGGIIVLGIPVELGLLVRYRQHARDRAIAEATSRERLDLARELHDTVAHHVSAIAVQAQAGQAVAAADPAAAVAVLAVIEDAASRTLAEMRAMVGTLRSGSETDLTPRQGVADLPRLADVAPAGLRVVVDSSLTARALDPAIDAALFRIAQEAVTNAVRHAHGASTVRVEVRDDRDCVCLRVVDDGAGRAVGTPGYGLLGMGERAHLLGGSFAAGPAPGRGWAVTASFPRSVHDADGEPVRAEGCR